MTLDEMRRNAYGGVKKTPEAEKDNKSIKRPVFESINNHPELLAATEALKSGGLIKVAASVPKTDGKDSVYRRVAKFLVLIGADEAAKILPHLSKEQTERIIPEIASIRSVDKEEAAALIKEFESLMQKARENGGVETARNILEKAFGSDKAEELLEKSVPFKDGRPFDYLMEADWEKVSVLLKDEGAPVRAIVLSQLNPKVSAQVIQNLPDDEKKELIVRLAKMQKIDPQILKRVDEAMREKFDAVNIEKSDSVDGKNTLAQILKRMSPENEEKLLDTLSEQEPELGADLRERLFTTEDIINSDDKFIQNQLRSMSDDECSLLIAGKDDAFRSKILGNMSSHRASEVLNVESYKKPFRKTDVEKAASQFFAVLRRAWEDGKLIIKGRDGDVYVE